MLHQASSFIKKLIIMTQPRMIEQRREFMRHPDIYLKISYHSYFSITLPNIASSRRITVFREMRGATLCPGPSPGLHSLARRSITLIILPPPPSAPTNAADTFQNMSYAKVYHGMIRDFSYTFATILKIHNTSRTCTHVGRYSQIVIFLKVDGKSTIFMNTNMPHDSQ